MELMKVFSDKSYRAQQDIAEIIEMLSKDAFTTQRDVRNKLRLSPSTASDRWNLMKERLHAHVYFSVDLNKLPNNSPKCPDCRGQDTTMQITLTPHGKRKVTGMHCNDCKELKRRGQLSRTLVGMYENGGQDLKE